MQPNRLFQEIHSAIERIAPHVRKTYLEHSAFYSKLTEANVYFKCENLQATGSFKLRGATNKYLSLTPQERQQGVVAASTGNHGKAVAFAASNTGGDCVIFAPTSVDDKKLNAMRDMGARIEIEGTDSVESEIAARNYAEQNQCTYISPYNDVKVVAGQGTIGMELCEQLNSIDAVFATVGGGGLMGGIASYVSHQHPNCRFVGCSPSNSNVMLQSLEAGKTLDIPSELTLSEGSFGGIEMDCITFELCKQITQSVSVSESEIAKNLIQFINVHGMLIEGSAAVPIASLLKIKNEFVGKNVVIILCGSNISAEKIAEVSERIHAEHK